MRLKSIPFVLFLLVTFFTLNKAVAQTVDMVGPVGSGAYGASVTALPNGNYVVVDPYFTKDGIDSIGAIFLYNGTTHKIISTLLVYTLEGSSGDNNLASFSAGYRITTLTNGNYVISSPYYSDGTFSQMGAVTWCSADTGLNGVVNATNSLVGSSKNDEVGKSVAIVPLNNGNYIVQSFGWSNGNAIAAGAVTWCRTAKQLAK